MAEGQDGGAQQWLLQTLQASLDPEPTARKAAEEAVAKASSQPGYGVALANIATSKDFPLGVRQLAGVMLKQYAKQHWQEGEVAYTPPTVSSEDKAAIRGILLQGLDDAEGKIRTALGVAVATIAAFDWPEEWPDLMPHLLTALGSESNVNAVSGAVRCLALFADEIDDAQLPALVPTLFPALYAISSNPQAYNPQVRRRALYILHSCIATLGVMSGAAQTRKLMEPLLPAWMHHFAGVLGQPVPSESPEDWGLRLEVYKCLMQIIQNFRASVEPLLPVVLGPLWQSYVSGIPVYERAAVWGQEDAFTGLADEDGADQSLATLAVQEFEFLLALVGHPRFKTHVENSTEALAYFAIAYMQMTEEQEQAWSADPNQFVSDEENEVLTVRVSAGMLLEQLVEQFGERALLGVAVAVQRRLQEAAQQRAAQQPSWWKMREASILAVGCVADELAKAEMKEVREAFDPVRFAETVLAEDTGPGTEAYPFLQGRALWAVAKSSAALKPELAASFLQAAVQGLGSTRAGAVQVGACRALAELCPRVALALLRPALPAVYSGIGGLLGLGEAGEEVLHLALWALEAAIKADGEATAQMEASVAPAVLKIWAEHVTDPVVSVDAQDVLEAIADAPGCLEPLLHHATPPIAAILAAPQEQPPGLVAGALDLLTMLLKRSPAALVRAVHDALFGHLAALALSSGDHSELQNSAVCLTALVRHGGPALLDWGGDPARTMKVLLDAAARLLSPELEGSASLFAGDYVTQLIVTLPVQMAPHLRDLIGALGRRMAGQAPTVKASLILVFARLVHLSAPDVGQLLEILSSLPAEGHENALHMVMAEWVECHGDILGAYRRKVSTTALALLLASGDARLAAITVKGQPVKAQTSGIVTRSRARMIPEQWTQMTFPAKIVSLLADVLVELQEQASASGAPEDDEWEEYDEEEEERQAEAAGVVREAAGASAAAAGDSGSAQLLKQLLAAELAEGDDEFEDDPYAAQDPINEINMATYIADYLHQFASRYGPDFAKLCQVSSFHLADQGGRLYAAAVLAPLPHLHMIFDLLGQKVSRKLLCTFALFFRWMKSSPDAPWPVSVDPLAA